MNMTEVASKLFCKGKSYQKKDLWVFGIPFVKFDPKGHDYSQLFITGSHVLEPTMVVPETYSRATHRKGWNKTDKDIMRWIFEHDIVIPIGLPPGSPGEVKMIDGSWVVDSRNRTIPLFMEGAEWEIIGNSIDNPELLEPELPDTQPSGNSEQLKAQGFPHTQVQEDLIQEHLRELEQKEGTTNLATEEYAKSLGFIETHVGMLLNIPGRIGRQLWLIEKGGQQGLVIHQYESKVPVQIVDLHNPELDGPLTAVSLKKIVEAIS